MGTVDIRPNVVSITLYTCRTLDLQKTTVVQLGFRFILKFMGTHSLGKGPQLGEFIAAAYATCSEAEARKIVQLAIGSRLVRLQDAGSIQSLMKRIDIPVPSHETKKYQRRRQNRLSLATRGGRARPAHPHGG